MLNMMTIESSSQSTNRISHYFQKLGKLYYKDNKMFDWFRRKPKPKPKFWHEITDRSTKDGQDLTDQEISIINATQRCPDCGGEILTGPEGGSSLNIKCIVCNSRFNWCFGGLYAERISEPLQLIKHNRTKTC